MTSRLRHERLSLAAFTICFVSMLFLTLGVGRVAAEQVSSTCSGVSCVRQTVWFNDSGDYYRESGSSATGATFNLVAADLYGYNIYHYGSQGRRDRSRLLLLHDHYLLHNRVWVQLQSASPAGRLR